MKAWRYSAAGSVPELVDLPDPVCPPDGLVLAVEATGLCRSDWHAWTGHDPVPLPMVPGHEFAGTVLAVGPEVTRVRPGQRVTAPFALGCGRCVWCRAGDTHVCPHQEQPGFTIPGSFAERLAVPRADVNVVALPDHVSAIAGAALGCRFATAYAALVNQARLQAGEWLVVFGCGGVGLSAVLIATAMGARVVAVDPQPAAVQRARDMGAEAGLVLAEDPVETIREFTGGGAAVALEAIGDPHALSLAVRSLRPRGRHVQVGLLLGAPAGVPMDLVVSRELSILGSHGMPARDYPALLAFLADGSVDPVRLVGAVLPLTAAGPALMAMDQPGPAGTTVFTPAG